ncbi:transaldolase family protein [Propionicicella superfundia]|uniref:transaldolase family protein n=1 Tax=Propionicicella superfundia TaxID=348582 RepID=UPI00040011B3|nr:transaldolase family protein [Propionicicella superfundia]
MHSPSFTARVRSLGLPVVRGEEDYVARVLDQELAPKQYLDLKQVAQYIGVTQEFKDVVDYFKTPAGHTPAGFRVEYTLAADGVLQVDLARDISRDTDGAPRPTGLLFSADSANPYEVEPISPLLANLTCNPGIIYDLFINNPKANVGGAYKTRDEVMAELGRILGPGCDISVELNNPFEEDFNKILEEAEKFKEMLSKWRVVIKVPHTGPVNKDNVGQLLTGDARLDTRYSAAATKDALRGHNLTLKLHENDYRVNFTLMFEPYQTQLALQARPYFINSFVRHRLVQSEAIAKHLSAYAATQDEAELTALRAFMIKTDYYAAGEDDVDLKTVFEDANWIVNYRDIEGGGADGLDGLRHNLEVLRGCNMDDTRLIVCSMEGPSMYPDLDAVLADPAYSDMADRVVITAEPGYLARFTSTNQVVSYQRRFMKAAQGQS